MNIKHYTTAGVGCIICMTCAAAPTAADLYRDTQQNTRTEQTQQTSAPTTQPVQTPVQLPAKTAAPTGAHSFVVEQLVFTGNHIMTDAELQRMAAAYLQQRHDLASLRTLTTQITKAYRSRGYLLAHAYIPPQSIRQGKVSIHITEGQLDNVMVNNHSDVQLTTINKLLAPLAPNTHIHQDRLNRTALVLAEQPGLSHAKFSLKPSAKAGTSDIMVTIPASKKSQWQVYTDNMGNYYSGQYRVGVSGQVDNLLGNTDRLKTGVSITNEGTANGHISWDTLLSSQGLRAGVGGYVGSYQLGKDFETLDASGKAVTLETYASYPAVRTLDHRINLATSLQHRSLTDRVKRANQHNKKTATAWVNTAQGQYQQGNYHALWQADVTLGKLALKDTTAKALDKRGANTAGNYGKFNAKLIQTVHVTPKLAVNAQVRGQLASKNLDASEKLSLGGLNNIAAYPVGEAAGDEGVVGQLEMRYRINNQLNAAVGYAAGKVTYQNTAVTGANNHESLTGVHASVNADFSAFTLGATVAARTDRKATSAPDKKPRVLVKAAYRF